VDVLKLDMCFMQGGRFRQKKNILSFIISLGKWLNLLTIAEGVETQEQVQMLKNMGCRYVQGYFFAKPMPMKDFQEYLKRTYVEKQPDKTLSFNSNSDTPNEDVEKNGTVLIVDDNELNRAVLSDMISSCYSIIEAENGKEALEHLIKHKDTISVILLDLMMPVMDGFQFMNYFRKYKEFSGIPVIVTSEERVESELWAVQQGSDFVSKPYRQEVLLFRIKRSIEERKLYKLQNTKKV